MRIKAIISYKGTSFYGFQIQKNEKLRSIQKEFEDVLNKIFHEDIKISASGRTDKGVHALGQVIHFDIAQEMSLYRLRYSLNCLLPKDIHVISLEKVDEEFHSRYLAKSKTYRYIVSLKEPSPFLIDFVYTVKKPLDIDLMKEGMKLFLGEHDFHNFCTNDEDFVRKIYSFDVEEKDGLFIFNIKGNGFRRYMVRMIMGTIIELGLKKITLKDVDELINTEQMCRVRYKAPAEGLYLVAVDYEGEDYD